MEKLQWVVLIVVALAIGLFLSSGPETQLTEPVNSVKESPIVQLEECGYVQHEIFLGEPGMPVLFVVEEDHANLAVQAEVARIIERLFQTGLQFLVLVEGSPPSPLGLHELMDIADPAVVNAVTAAWFEEGWLSGVEVAALSTGGSLPVVGLEPPTSAERVAHREAMDLAYLYKGVVAHLVELLKFSWEVQGSLPTDVAEAWSAVEEAEQALSLGGGSGGRFSKLLETIATGVTQGIDPYQIMAQLRDVVTPSEVNHSQLYDAYESALLAYCNTVIEAASREEASLVSEARELWTRPIYLFSVEGDELRNSLPVGELDVSVPGSLRREFERQGFPLSAVAKIREEKIGEKEVSVWLITDQAKTYVITLTNDARLNIFWFPAGHSSFAADLTMLRNLVEVWAQHERDELEARNRRDEAMVEMLLQELSSRGYRTGLMVVGAGHTANLKRILKERGITYVIITPRSLGALTPWREVEWYERRMTSRDSDQLPLPWFLGGGVFKAEMLLYLPEGREAFATALSLSEGLKRALAGGQPISAGTIQRSEVSTVGDSVRVEYESVSGQVVEITLPQDFSLTETAFKQLNKHLLEIGHADEHLQQFPAVHVYLEPDGQGGGAFITWATQGRVHVTGVQFDLGGYTMEELLEPFQVGAVDVSFVRRHLEELLAARVILDPITQALNAALEELGVAPQEVVRVAVRTSSQELRAFSWDTLATLARETGIEGYERPLVFVKSALADDYEYIRGEDKEQVLATTLRHIASWGPPGKHLVVMTIPRNEDEWAAGNPFANHLKGQGWTWEKYQEEVLPYIEQFVETVRGGGGEVIEPSTLGEFIEGLRTHLQGVEHGVVTITLVSHRTNKATEPMIHFKGAESAVPVSTVVQAIQYLKLAKLIPAVDLRLNFIVCQGQEAAPLLVSKLDSPTVLTSPRPLSVSTSMVFMSKLFSELQSGLAGWEAYYRTKEWFIDSVLNSSPEELSDMGIRTFEVPELHSVRELSGVC